LSAARTAEHAAEHLIRRSALRPPRRPSPHPPGRGRRAGHLLGVWFLHLL